MSAKETVKWGVLSTSRTAMTKAIPALQRCADARVTAIASRDPDKACRAASKLGIRNAYGNYDVLLEDPEIDAVYLPLPNSLHAEYTEKAASSGKHVLCEKPAALTVEAAAGMIKACEAANVYFMEGFAYRFLPQIDSIKEMVATGLVGNLRLLRIAFSFTLQNRHSTIRLQRSLDGGALADLGVYLIDLACLLVGRVPRKVFCVGNRANDGEVETDFAAVLEFPGGVHAVLDGAFDRPRESPCQVIGEHGRVTVDSAFLSGSTKLVHTDANGGETLTSFEAVDHFELQFAHFSRSILTGTMPRISAEETLRNARVLAGLRASLAAGSPMTVEDTSDTRAATIED